MARYCGTLPKKKLAYGGQASPFGGNPQNDALYDPQGAKNQTIDRLGTGVASYFGPWWGALAAAGTVTSKAVKGTETSRNRSIAGQFTDPFNQFKNKTGADWLLSFGNPFRSAVTKGKQRVKEVQAAKASQASAKNKAFGPSAEASLNQMFAGDQPGAPQFAGGGAMEGKPVVTSGGKLKYIAGDVVQVQANAPGKDTVKTPMADLDGGEIIDGQNKVYSNRIPAPGGGTIATKAKAAAKRGESLAPLYNLQESMKTQTMPKKRYAAGGQMDPGPKTRMGLTIKPKSPVKKDLLPPTGGPQLRARMRMSTKDSKTGAVTNGPWRDSPLTPISQDEFYNNRGESKQRPVKIKGFSRSGFR